jgi:hypothetical protein
VHTRGAPGGLHRRWALGRGLGGVRVDRWVLAGAAPTRRLGGRRCREGGPWCVASGLDARRTGHVRQRNATLYGHRRYPSWNMFCESVFTGMANPARIDGRSLAFNMSGLRRADRRKPSRGMIGTTSSRAIQYNIANVAGRKERKA